MIIKKKIKYRRLYAALFVALFSEAFPSDVLASDALLSDAVPEAFTSEEELFPEESVFFSCLLVPESFFA